MSIVSHEDGDSEWQFHMVSNIEGSNLSGDLSSANQKQGELKLCQLFLTQNNQETMKLMFSQSEARKTEPVPIVCNRNQESMKRTIAEVSRSSSNPVQKQTIGLLKTVLHSLIPFCRSHLHKKKI